MVLVMMVKGKCMRVNGSVIGGMGAVFTTMQMDVPMFVAMRIMRLWERALGGPVVK